MSGAGSEGTGSDGMRLLMETTIGELEPRPHAEVAPDAALADVVDEMKRKRRGCVLVVDGDALVGIFTERDLMARVDHTSSAWMAAPVRDVMTPAPTTSRAGDSLLEALRTLVSDRRRHLPVVDDGGRVVSLLSVRDILTFVAGRFPEEMVNLPPDPGHES